MPTWIFDILPHCSIWLGFSSIFFFFGFLFLALLPPRLFASTWSVVFFMHLHKAKCISMLCSTLFQHFHCCFFWGCFYCTFPFLAITAHSCILMSTSDGHLCARVQTSFNHCLPGSSVCLFVCLLVCLFVCLFVLPAICLRTKVSMRRPHFRGPTSL